jgi:hypothetical protein
VEGEEVAKAIAGAISSGGSGLTQTNAESLLEDGAIDQTKVNEMAEQLGYGSAAAWAEAMNMSLADFYKAIEDNAKDATKGFDKITSRLKDVGIEVTGVVEKAGLTLQ